MQITGAVLRAVGASRPYVDSTPLDVVPLELDGPRETEVLVEIEVASVCHSDLSVVDGSRSRPTPMLLGHEAAGRVLEVGAGVDDVTVGQRLVLTFLPRCGTCSGCASDGVAPCVLGTAANGAGEMLAGGMRLTDADGPVRHHLGVSGFATHAVVDRRSVVPVDDDVPAEVAALLGCAVLTGGGAVLNAARPVPGSTLAVVGLGGVGMAALITALAFDDVEVVGVDTSQVKRDQALRLGATRALSPDEAGATLKADRVIEAVGRSAAFELAVTCTAVGGTTITVGLPAPGDTAVVSPLGLVAEGRTIVGSYLGSSVPARDLPIFVDLWRRGRLPVEQLISSSVPLSRINDAMDRLADGSELRQLVTMKEEA
ncbi:alcohol dehydrogenase catalytic domain-containing protein [Nocardioides jishulii]|uniref:Zinc-binding dehydrogenase n=1 Tax=Nocardioides jishulii TaxID=2575440 RepID=A0A4U2YML6_9ACTN|nr:alcohol dehydrogenase catalytic domain-containing protein [Nocardioides jishulii]QCX27651.1 zinc-binding dehydrogenase [Nocardioides jishulii]TKI62458.1 zinc-binding dehydrogenase [Nocardioides jishulii]